jgi:glycerol-3-phosphate O-acyltransferase
MTYYRNNIAHMLMLPSLMAAIITSIVISLRTRCCAMLTALSDAESRAVLRWEKELAGVLESLAQELLRQG